MRYEVNLFTMGTWVAVLAFAVALLGVLLGIGCLARMRRADTTTRGIPWVVLGGIALGGIGVWVMQLIALLGFVVVERPIRYNLTFLGLAGLAAIVATGAAFLVRGTGTAGVVRVIGSGLVYAVGILAAHYLGVMAMDVGMDIQRDTTMSAIFLAAAVVSAVLTMLGGSTRRPIPLTAGIAILSAAAITATQYVGMASVYVSSSGQAQPVTDGVVLFNVLMPTLLGCGIAAAAVMWMIFATDPQLAAVRESRSSDQPEWTPPPLPAGQSDGGVHRAANQR